MSIKRNVLLFLFSALSFIAAMAQTESTKTKKNSKDQHSVFAGVTLPVGYFSNTHLIGTSISYSPSSARMVFLKQPIIAFTYNGGGTYYWGKKEKVSGYSYKYPGYLFIYAFAGVQYSPARKTVITLTAGPAGRRYNGITRFNIGSQLELQYYIHKKWAIAAGILLLKEHGADPLAAASVKTGWVF